VVDVGVLLDMPPSGEIVMANGHGAWIRPVTTAMGTQMGREASLRAVRTFLNPMLLRAA
jgi:hypothetical protein